MEGAAPLSLKLSCFLNFKALNQKKAGSAARGAEESHSRRRRATHIAMRAALKDLGIGQSYERFQKDLFSVRAFTEDFFSTVQHGLRLHIGFSSRHCNKSRL